MTKIDYCNLEFGVSQMSNTSNLDEKMSLNEISSKSSADRINNVPNPTPTTVKRYSHYSRVTNTPLKPAAT